MGGKRVCLVGFWWGKKGGRKEMGAERANPARGSVRRLFRRRPISRHEEIQDEKGVIQLDVIMLLMRRKDGGD